MVHALHRPPQHELGVVFEPSGTGVLHECDIAENGTQGVFAATAQRGAALAPVVTGGRVHKGCASGIKVAKGADVTAHAVCFEANVDHDIDVESGGHATVCDSRFRGGSNEGLVCWDLSRVNVYRSSFAPYGLWAVVVHERSYAVLADNVFTSDAACTVAGESPAAQRHRVATWADSADDGGGSGLLLQERVRGTASNNVFIGWQPGYTRGRCAFCLVKCGAFRNEDGRVVSVEQWGAQPERLRHAVAAVASNDPGSAVVDLRVVPLPPTATPAARGGPAATPPRHADPISDEGLALLCDVMAVGTSTTHLDLAGNNITDAGAERVGRVLSGHPALAQVSIADNPAITTVGFEAFTQGVAEAPALECVDVRGLNLAEDPGMLQMATRAVAQNPRVKRFAIDERAKQGANALIADELEFMCSVNAHSSTPAVRENILAVQRNDRAVLSVDLGGDALTCDGDDAIRIAAFSLKQNTCVATLTLDARALTSHMLHPLSSMLLSQPACPLTSLSLRNSGIDDVTGLAGALVASNNTRLTALDLTGNKLGKRKNAAALAALFSSASTAVRSLDISRNHFDPTDIDFIVAAVPQQRSDVVIHAEDNDGVAPGGDAANDDGAVAGNAASTPAARPKKSRVNQPNALRSTGAR